jgi:hypothetical protein
MATASLSPARLHTNASANRWLPKLLRRLTAAADIGFGRFLIALHESRRRQAARFIAENTDLTIMAAPANKSPRRSPPKQA